MRLKIMVSLSLGVLIVLAAITTLSVRAQNTSPQSAAPTTANPAPTASPQSSPAAANSPGAAPATAAQPTATPAPPRVTAVEGHLELDNVIQVQIDHLPEWAANHDASKLVPYLNGRAIRGNYPEEIHTNKNHIHFHLHITPDNREVWVDLLGEPPGTIRPVAFSVGLETQAPFDSVYDQGNRIPLTVISPWYGVIALLVSLLTLILFVWLARTTNLIREPGTCPLPGKLKPYNLGRTQMAFWFFLIYVSYLAIWLITDSLNTITPALLGLMGISAGTALSEALIDSGKDSEKVTQLQNLTAEKQTLEQSIPSLQAQIDNLNAKTGILPEDITSRDNLNKQLQDSRTRLAQISQQLQALTPSPSADVSKGFLTDILSDASGYSFHRFQIFAWTIVLGIIFASSVYNGLNMPEFSPTLLGLMGLSSGTYIGFKFPEKK